MAVVDMETDIAEVGNWLGNYLRAPEVVYKVRVFDDAEDFWEEEPVQKASSHPEEQHSQIST